MKIVNMAALIVLSILAMNCGDKPPQDPSTAVDQDAAPPASTETAPSSPSK